MIHGAQKRGDDLHHCLMDGFNGPGGVNTLDIGELQALKNGSNFLESGFLFKVVEGVSTCYRDPFNANLWRNAEEQGQIRVRGKTVFLNNIRGRKADCALVGSSGEKIAVAEDNLSFLQRWCQELLNMLLAVGEEELQLLFPGDPISIGVEGSDLLTEMSICGLSGLNYSKPFLSSGWSPGVTSGLIFRCRQFPQIL